MSDILTASIVVDFGAAAATGVLKAEAYSELNSSPLKLTDQFNYLIFKSSNVFYNTPLLSSGSSVFQGSVLVEKEDTIVVVDDSAISLSYESEGVVDFDWYGPEPDTTVKQSDGTYVFTGTYPFVAKVTYKTRGDHHLLTPPVLADDITEYKIVIYVVGGINV